MKATFYFKKKETGGEKVGDKLGDRLGDNELKILELIKKNPSMSITEMAEKNGKSTTAVENNIKKLKEKNILVRTGSAKSGSWKIVKQKK